MKQFVTEESFWELFPEARIGIVVAHGMKPGDQVPPESAAAIAKGLREANEAADAHLNSNTISQNQVVAVWRDAYQRFKTKKGARCSVENLLKRVLKGNPVGSITPSVDIYNTVSLKYALPVGGEDIDSFDGDIVTTIGPKLEEHEIWPEKANIEFVRVDDPHNLSMRAWERGAGETMACGTGACAAAAAAVATGRAKWPVTMRLIGGNLGLDMAADGHIMMTGPAVTEYSGTYYQSKE